MEILDVGRYNYYKVYVFYKHV